jgi:hypothetical protein
MENVNVGDSSFNPESFLDATTTEALVRRPPLPVGDYLGFTGEIKSRTWHSNKVDAKVRDGVAFDIPVKIDLTQYPEQQALLGGIDSVTLTAGVMIDAKEGGGIDWGTGKNGALRRWREALDMNKPGETFSARQMSNRPVRVKVSHRIYEGEAFDQIDSVAKA